VRRPTGDPLDGAHLCFKAGQIEMFDDTPNLARGVLVVDQAVHVEGFEAKLLTINGNVLGAGADVVSDTFYCTSLQSTLQRVVQRGMSLEVSLAADQRYGLLERVLAKQRYRRLSRGDKGIVRRFLCKVAGLSRAQLTRLIARWVQSSKIERQATPRPRFPRRYTAADIALLAELDSVHEQLSGPATRRLLERGYSVFGDERFQRLAGISVSHIYNLRASAAYRKIRVQVTRTQARQVAIGERRKPDPQGRPGYLRVDTMHQGHHETAAGSTTSMPSIRSPSGRWLAASRRSRNGT
jgi:hypothetical protein